MLEEGRLNRILFITSRYNHEFMIQSLKNNMAARSWTVVISIIVYGSAIILALHSLNSNPMCYLKQLVCFDFQCSILTSLVQYSSILGTLWMIINHAINWLSLVPHRQGFITHYVLLKLSIMLSFSNRIDVFLCFSFLHFVRPPDNIFIFCSYY